MNVNMKLIVACVILTGLPGIGDAKTTRDSTTHVSSCADLVNHKHPGLKKAAWTAEWNKCNNDRAGYRDAP
jgi:hypothetical protein